MKVEGVDKVNAMLQRRADRAVTASVIVGYEGVKYALWVHENMEAKNLGKNVPRKSGIGVYWGPTNYGPKYLEGPAREFKDELVSIIERAFVKGATVVEALLLAGLRLQRESQLRVPVEYGTLKNSAFTRQDTNG